MITEDFSSKGDLGAVTEKILSPMPGRIVKFFVEPGQAVKKGQNIVAVESMKMEYFVKASRDGVIDKLFGKEGDAVEMK